MDDREMDFWCRAVLRAARAIMGLDPKRQLNPKGVAHLASEYADALLMEFQRRFAVSKPVDPKPP